MARSNKAIAALTVASFLTTGVLCGALMAVPPSQVDSASHVRMGAWAFGSAVIFLILAFLAAILDFQRRRR